MRSTAAAAMPSANRTGSITCRIQYSGSVTSAVTSAPSTQLTNGSRGGLNEIDRTTASYSASIGRISGEWNACDTTSGLVLMPTASSREVISATAAPAPEMTVCAGVLTAAMDTRSL